MGLLIAVYLIGSLPMGYWLVRSRTGEDIRSFGSGVTGAFNVGRRLGWRGFAATALLDLGKGMAAMILAQASGAAGDALAAVMFALILGHIVPLWLRGRGGNGLAPACGAFLVWDGRVFAAVMGLVLVMAAAGAALSRIGINMPVYTPSKIALLGAAPLAFFMGLIGVPGLIGLLLCVTMVLISVAGNMRRLRVSQEHLSKTS